MIQPNKILNHTSRFKINGLLGLGGREWVRVGDLFLLLPASGDVACGVGVLYVASPSYRRALEEGLKLEAGATEIWPPAFAGFTSTCKFK